MDDLGSAFLFLVVVGLIIGVGLVVGMIAAGRIDRLMTPAPKRPADGEPPADGVGTDPVSTKEDQP
jgi:hypothetical protein